MHLIYDIDLVLACLWRYSHTIDYRTNVVDTVVGSGIELELIEGCSFVETAAVGTLITSFSLGSDVPAIDGLGQDAGTGRFTNPARTTKQKGMCQLFLPDGIAKGGGNM